MVSSLIIIHSPVFNCIFEVIIKGWHINNCSHILSQSKRRLVIFCEESFSGLHQKMYGHL